MFEPLPALIRLQREAHGLTIDGLSALAGVSRTRLIALEKGDDNVTLELLVKLANALKMTELRIGGLRVTGATQEFKDSVAAAEALETLRKIGDQATREYDRLVAPVAAMVAPVVTHTAPVTATTDKTLSRKRDGRR